VAVELVLVAHGCRTTWSDEGGGDASGVEVHQGLGEVKADLLRGEDQEHMIDDHVLDQDLQEEVLVHWCSLV